ncbi:MAG: ASCH domain-containing protein [Clostridia bacterium]|nr:ASCH domain-containing protein [Clostridia bacterium]
MSVRPEWLAKILNGEKTVEIRTRVPKDFVGEIHLACTKAKPYLYTVYGQNYCLTYDKKVCEYNEYGEGCCFNVDEVTLLNGKVVAKIDYDYKKVDNIYYVSTLYSNTDGAEWEEEYKSYLTPLREILKKTVLSYAELENYGKEKNVFAIPLTNLAIFNKPRELGKYYVPNTTFENRHLNRCPQSYQFAYVEEE